MAVWNLNIGIKLSKNPGDTTSDADGCCDVRDDVFILVWTD